MTKGIKRGLTIGVLSCLVLIFTAGNDLQAQSAVPKPGTVIDKNNIDQYKDFFPPEFREAFITGWDLIPPLSITVGEAKPNPTPEEFLAASEQNRGKYAVDAAGYITGGPDAEIVGYPFPDIKPGDPEFALRYFWNFDYRYSYDDTYVEFINYQKRRGESVTLSEVHSNQLSYQSRMFDDPRPHYVTSSGWRSVNLMHVQTPPSTRDMMYSLVRYKDQKLADLTYVYLPTMRRVLRGEAGQRSTPIASSTQAPDDFTGGFTGRIPEFTFNFIGETQVVALVHAKVVWSDLKGKNIDYIPIEMDNWQVTDVYVFDIVPKDPKYPQSKKRIWVNKENLFPQYCISYDRSGNFWKIWHSAGTPNKNYSKPGATIPYMTGMLGIDVQLGYAVQMVSDWRFNGNGLRESDINTAAMRRRAR